MTTTENLRAQIDRSTQRLAQLRARELLAEQRAAMRAREATRRSELQRRNRVAALVFAAGCDQLPDGEIVGALLGYREEQRDPQRRAMARSLGDAHLATIEAGAGSQAVISSQITSRPL